MNLKELQNGSDIRGIALGKGQNLTDEAARKLAAAFTLWLEQKSGKKPVLIAVGRDSRVTGPSLVKACVEGLTEAGATVIDCGMASTPAMFMTTVFPQTDTDGAIMVTASHMPMNRNGLKFFTKTGGVEKDDISAIIALAESTRPQGDHGQVKNLDFISLYADDLVSKVRQATGTEHPLKGLRIIVDAGNGAGGFYAEKVLKPLGADTDGSQFLEPDGNFPNHIPNPENPEAMNSIIEAVKRTDADLGIIFDTDVDRAGAVDKGGKVLNRDRLIAVLSAILLKEDPGTTIVTDSVTSTGLADFIKQHGGIHHRFKRGYRNVINESIRLNDAGQDSALAIETSGHAAFKDNYFLDDGAYLITRLLIEAAALRQEDRTISDLIADLKDPVESVEFRLPIRTQKEFGNKVIDELQAFCTHREAEGIEIAPDNYEGIRVSFAPGHGDGWFLLRLSLHEPLMPLNIESDASGGVLTIARFLYDFLKQYQELDLSPIADYLAQN